MELSLPRNTTSDRIAHGQLAALVARAHAGDAVAFRELFLRYHDRVFHYVAVRLGSPEEARDVAQEVFLAAWKGLPSFRPHHDGSFPAWLFGIARNLTAESLRRTLRRQTVALDAWPDETVEFEGSLVSRRSISDALLRLPETQREVVVLRFIAGLPTREISVVIGKTESAISALQVRGLRRLEGST